MRCVPDRRCTRRPCINRTAQASSLLHAITCATRVPEALYGTRVYSAPLILRLYRIVAFTVVSSPTPATLTAARQQWHRWKGNTAASSICPAPSVCGQGMEKNHILKIRTGGFASTYTRHPASTSCNGVLLLSTLTEHRPYQTLDASIIGVPCCSRLRTSLRNRLRSHQRQRRRFPPDEAMYRWLLVVVWF